jgi:hypothetical protein
MNRSRLLIVAFVVASALASWSCTSASGIGVGMEAPTRWGGGGSSSGPPIFVGGPSF